MRVSHWLWRRRRLLIAASDAACWAIGLTVGTWFRYDRLLYPVVWGGLGRCILLAVALQWSVGGLAQLYRGRYWVGSFDEARCLCSVMVGVGWVVFLVDLIPSGPWIPRSVPLTGTLIALMLAVAARATMRAYRERLDRPGSAAERVVIFGAGNAGRQLVRSMLGDASGGYVPVALLDDSQDLRHLRVSGIPVLGNRDDVGRVARARDASLLVIAVPSATAEMVRDVSRVAIDAGLGVKVLPGLSELFRDFVGVSDLRDLDLTDLLGRHQIETDVRSVAGYLQGKRVLVTGAGGSIGSELCRQIRNFDPAELLMLDRDESALHTVQLSLYGRALLDTPDVILCDIRDREALRSVFTSRSPEVVFHAAALKHLPMLEQYPDEGWKTNVLGTLNVLEVAAEAGVERFVNISTDKAANPVSVLGYTKRIAERLTAGVATDSARPYLSVRFGNVLGSRGSVVIAFAEQIASGGPVTVTHPEVSRFFMTIPEAVELVIQAAAIGRPGEALVLDMGSPVRIDDVARQLIDLADHQVPVVYTGLREGEKLHEELFGDGETDQRPFHRSISHVSVPTLPADRVRATGRQDSGGLRRLACISEDLAPRAVGVVGGGR